MKYNKIYNNNWGDEPNKLLLKVVNLVKAKSEFLDLGCGQGRDSLFMLQKGFKVTAIDKSKKDIKIIKEFIQTNNLPISKIDLFCKDIKNFKIEKNKYTIINAFNSLHFLLKKDALKFIEEIKKNIKDDGYIIISCFKAGNPSYKETNNTCYFESQELRKIFFDFDIIFYVEEEILGKGHAGHPKPHKHSIVRIIATRSRSPK